MNLVHFLGKISSPYPALGPDPRNLISFAIFIRQTAVVFIVPEKLTIESWAASSANLFSEGLKGSLVIFFISETIFFIKSFSSIYSLSPQQFHLGLKSIFLLKHFLFFLCILLIENNIQKILDPK